MADTLQESGDALETVKTENETAAGAQVLREWEQDLKHIFILTSSGKPIFSKHGDEQYLSTTFGLIQAVVSIVENAGDRISCIIAGNRRIVYFLRSYLYFVSISSTEEPEAVLSAQLEFLYKHIIFVLTSKVHDVLRLNPSKDIRDLLGYDTLKQMYQSCCSDITPSYIAFNALNGFVCAEDLRHKINYAMMDCIEQSGAVMGVILYRDQLLSYCTNFAIDLQLSTSDLNLLASFVGKSNSLRSNDQNWVPICLPDFNPRAYLQAYVCNLKLDGASTSKQIDVSLVLISTSADPAMFNALHNGRQTLEKALIASDIPERLIIALESQKAYLSLYAMPISCLNFLFIFRPSPPLLSEVAFKGRQTRNKETVKQNKISAPVQCHSFALEDDASSSNDLDNILTEYQHIALHLRSGSSLPERNMPLGDDISASACGDDGTPAHHGSNGNVRMNPITSAPHSMPTAKGEEFGVLFSTLSSGLLVLCVRSEESELYTTFHATVSPAEANTAAKNLSDDLRRNACHLFVLST